MTIHELMTRIRLPEEAQQEVMKFLLEEKEYLSWKEIFYKDVKEFIMKWKASENHLQWVLSFYIQLACEVYDEYQKQNISDEIFNDSFYDITLWAIECNRKYGFYGLEEAPWVGVTMQMKLFRLGRLQFEPITLKEDRIGEKVQFKAGTKLLNTHIPAGEKMDYDECLKSIKKAEEFFGDTYEGYICDSWLLAPALKQFLSDDSNIVKFQNMFEIIKVHYSFPQSEQRIFEDIREDKENYPEDTTLRRKTKQFFVEGNDIGIGIGIFYKS